MSNEDLEKVKIDILRDAVKDVVDTIRALDKKIRYIISFNGLALGFISSVMILYKNELHIELFSASFVIGFMLLFPWIANLIGLLWAFDPKVNPNSIFCSKDDKESFNKCYFIPFQFNMFSWSPKEHVNLDDLVKNYDECIKNMHDVKLMLYKEISKLSYIRDVKIRNIKLTLKITIMSTFISFLLLFSFVYVGHSVKQLNIQDNNITVTIK
jgi:hypothetical protein